MGTTRICIERAEYVGGLVLHLFFSDGTSRQVDFEPFILANPHPQYNRYIASVGYTYDEATLKVGDNQRANMSISLTPKFFQDHLSVNVNAKGVYNRANYPNSGAIGDAISFSPTVPVKNADGTYFNWYSSDGSANTMAGINPLSQLYDPHNVNETWRSIYTLDICN